MNETRVEVIAIACFLITGLSHMLQPRAWIEFFTLLRGRGEPGVLVNAFLHLPLALVIVVFHPRWTGIAAVLTVLGWLWLLKATTYFLFPRVGLAGMNYVSHERRGHLVAAGAVLVFLAGLLAIPLVFP